MDLKILLSKVEENKAIIDGYRPFTHPKLLNEIKNFYKVDLTYTSNKIEGYGYTLSETKVLIEDGLTAGGKPLKDAYAVIGHAKAYDYMFELIHKDIIEEKDILFMHNLLVGSLENDSKAGQYREHEVLVTGSQYPVCQYNEIKNKMGELFQYIENNKNMNPLVLAAKFHKNFVYIHPFGDGNGRIARLGLNTLLIQRGYTPVIISPVRRDDYFRALEEGRINDYNFIQLIAQCEYESQKDLIRLLKGFNPDPDEDNSSTLQIS